MNSSGAIERQAVGRHGTIGAMYDIRTDTLEGTNLFNKELPPALIKTSDNAHLSYELDFNDSQKKTFDKLNIEGGLKLSLMSGLTDVGGSAKFLKQTKTDGQTVRVTFICKAKTKQEHLQISMADLHQYFSPDALENPNATHVVTGIMWGANVAATFERVAQNREKVKEIEGKLSLVLKGLPISGEAGVKYESTNNSDLESLQISFSGDLLDEACSRTIEGVMNIFEKIPSLIKPLNDGKGQQLVFVLYPLERMAQIFKHQLRIDRLIREVSDFLAVRVENIFDEISIGKRKFNDFLNEIKPWKDYISRDWQNSIRQKQTELIAAELKTRRQLSKLLQNIRGGQEEESEMEKLLDNFERENSCSLMSIERFLREKRHIKLKIQTLNEFNRETNLLKELTSIEDKILELHGKEVYLLHISDKWQTENKQNSLKQLRFFKYLMNSEPKRGEKDSDKQTIETAFIVIDCDLHHDDLADDPDRAETCCIYYAKHGTIESKDYFEYSQNTLTQNQITSILKENSKLSEQQILNRHKTFMEEHPTGELTKDDFVSELKKIYKNGNPTKYCDYIFTTMDKDKNGKISFYEFMSVVALTSTGNDDIEKRLGLIFDVIHRNDKGDIGIGELVEFIKIINELVNAEAGANNSYAEDIVIEMFELRVKNEKDGVISKEGFINCCQNNHQICCAFLPDIAREPLESDRHARNCPEIMYKIKKYYIERGEHKMTPVRHRNILLLGRARTGKSTLKAVLVDPTTVAMDMSLHSGTRDSHIESFNVHGEKIVLNITNTPGVYEIYKNKGLDLSNECILQTIKMFIQRKVTELHVICFCISISGGFNSEDIKSIHLLYEYFGENIGRNSCLIVTRCESKSKEQLDRIRSELREDSDFKSVFPLFGLGVFFSGALNRDDYDCDSNGSLAYQFKRVCEYRSKLIELFKSDIQPISINNMFGSQRPTRLCKDRR